MYLNHTVAVSTYSLHLLDTSQAGQSSQLIEQQISGIWHLQALVQIPTKKVFINMQLMV